MNFLADIVTYVRRIIKSPSNSSITDDLIIDYINRFYINDLDSRLQLFDLKTHYGFQTTPGISDYNMPLYDVQTQPGNQEIGSYPVYQGFMAPARVNGINVPLYTTRSSFFDLWPNYINALPNAGVGNGSSGPYTLTLPFFPAIPGHIDITGIIASGNNIDPPVNNNLLVNSSAPYNGNSIIPSTSVVPGVWVMTTGTDGSNIIVTDSGQFLTGNQGYGLLMSPGNGPFGNAPLPGGYSTTSNTVNYANGTITVTFPVAIPNGMPIQTQCYFFEQGLPRAILFYNNVITLRSPPNTQYLVEMDAYLTPAAFLNTSAAIPFGYMAEYIARGAARKILSDTGDVDQFQFYEGLFKEQETLVWKRSQRQFTATRTETIYSNSGLGGTFNSNGLFGAGAT